MFGAEIINDTLLGPFRVDTGVKMNSENYIKLLSENLISFYNTKSAYLAAKSTMQFLSSQRIKDKKLMIRPPNSSALNPIENFWAILKRKIYENGGQFFSVNDFWDAIVTKSKDIDPTVLKNLTKSVDERLLKVLKCYDGYINK